MSYSNINKILYKYQTTICKNMKQIPFIKVKQISHKKAFTNAKQIFKTNINKLLQTYIKQILYSNIKSNIKNLIQIYTSHLYRFV